MKHTDPPIIVKQVFDAPVTRVWDAITNHKEMIQWYFEMIPDFKPEVGFKTTFDVHSEDRTFPHIWEILEVIPNKKISYRWTYANYEGESSSTFELFEDQDQTTLVLTCEVHQDFDDSVPEFKRESCIGGWTYFIQGQLGGFLRKQ